jgi:DNA-binding LacI/PurR family transcriptional regulator
VITGSDPAAAAVRAVLTQHGISVPGEVSLVGYDDSEVARLSFNDLTSVRQDVDATVDAALRAIARRGSDPAVAPLDIATPATLSIRGSTAAPRRT